MEQKPKSQPSKAVFLDRDGVINHLVYYKEQGIVDSPLSITDFKLLPGTAKAIRHLNSNGYRIFIVSNQPGVAKNKLSLNKLQKISNKMLRLLQAKKAVIDGIYYCLHHHRAINRKYKSKCQCRKPKPGLILKAGREHNIDLKKSFMVGDNLSDVQAGKAAGCQTIFLGTYKCDHCRLMQKTGAYPDYFANDLLDAVRFIKARASEE